MKKILISIFCVFFVPITVSVFKLLFPLDTYPHFNPKYGVNILIYSLIIIYCLNHLFRNRPRINSILLSLLIGGLTLGYGIQIDYLPQTIACLLASIATMLCFLLIINPAWYTNNYFIWKQKGWINNIIILSIITVSCIILYLLEYGGVFHLSFSGFLSALAAGVSEELIFRVFFPTLIYTQLKICATRWNQLWIFIIITIPFSLIHLNYYDSLDFSKVLSCVFSMSVVTAIHTFLINKYGIMYGIYAHFLWDFMVLNRVVG